MRNRACACHLEQPKGKSNRIVTVCKSLGNHVTHGELSTVIESQIRNTSATQQQSLHLTGSNHSNKDSATNEASSSRDGGSARDGVTLESFVPLLGTNHSKNEKMKVSQNIMGSNAGNINTDNGSSLSEHASSFTASSKSFATNCKNRTDCVESRKAMLHANPQSIPWSQQQQTGKRKNVLQYTTDGYTASPKQTKYGSDTLLGLCQTQKHPGIRLNIEGYREQLADILKEMNRGDLLPMLNRSQPLFRDLVEDYYMRKKRPEEQTSQKRVLRSSTQPQQEHTPTTTTSRRQSSRIKAAKLQPVTCEVKMRVRIQYKSHRHLLTGIESVKNTPEERQMDKFFQATSIMRGRDTGCVVCNISFSDITYLGAFWRDYTNGALQEALRGVFLTEMMRQTAGDEELDLLVSVDEKDFLDGQRLLVKNLETGNVESPAVTGLNLRGQIGVPTTARIEHI